MTDLEKKIQNLTYGSINFRPKSSSKKFLLLVQKLFLLGTVSISTENCIFVEYQSLGLKIKEVKLSLFTVSI